MTNVIDALVASPDDGAGNRPGTPRTRMPETRKLRSMAMPIAHLNDIDIWYETYGSGFPLVFCHGGFGGLGSEATVNAPAWVAEFAEHFQVTLPDRRSSRRSGFSDAAHSMELLANDTLEVLHHLGHERAHIWGNSAGGPIAIQFALMYPEATQTLMAVETSPKFWNADIESDRDLLERLRERLRILDTEGEDAAYAARRTSGNVGFQAFRASRPLVGESDAARREARREALAAQLEGIPREERVTKYAGELRTYSAFVDWSARERFRQLTMPVLIPYSLDDTQVPNARWDELTAGMPNVTYLPVRGVDHGGTMTVPGVKDRMLAFLVEHTP